MRVPVPQPSIPALPTSKTHTETKASPDEPAPSSASLSPLSSIPTIKLSPEVSKALIEAGIFNHDPKTTVWFPPGKAATLLGAPVRSIAKVNLAGVPRLHPYKVAGEDDVLVPTLRSVIEQVSPVLDQPGLEPVAEAVALFVDAPEIGHALMHPSSKTTREKFFLFGTNIARFLALGSRATHLPLDDAMDNIITLFKSGEEVFVAGQEKSAGIAQSGLDKPKIADKQKAKPTH